MRGLAYNPGILPAEMIIRQRVKPNCDTATATPAKAKKMAALIENWTPPDGWCNGNDRDWHEIMKGYICDFLRKCNGFRVM